MMKNLLFTTIFAIFSTGLLAQTDILPPALYKPDNNATNQMPNAELDWYASNGIGEINYTVQIDTSNLFENPVSYSTQFTSQRAEDLLFGGTYYWRVMANDNSGPSSWSETRSLTIFDEVELDKPNDGATGQMPELNLIWKNRKGANFITGLTFYDVQVSFTEDFAAPYFEVAVPFGTFPADTNFYFTKATGLYFGTTNYWRVRARHNTDISEWSAVRSFSTINGVSLTEPANNAVNQNVDVQLKWTAIPGVIKFVYQVCTDPNFTFPCITDFTTTNSVTIPSLSFGLTYHWRVKGYHTIDTTDWSEERSFQIINSVILTSPVNNATGMTNLPTLKWTTINGADKYEVRWQSEDLSISDTAFSETNQFLMFKPLDTDKDYFWKVRAYNDFEISDWSETWQFHVGSQNTGELSLQKKNVRIFPNPCNGEFTIELNSLQANQVKVTILDFVGKSVFQETSSFQTGLDSKKFNTGEIKEGLYFLQLNVGENIYTEKLIIK